MMEVGERLVRETYSYDARVVKLLPRSWSSFACLLLDLVLYPLQSHTRGKGARPVHFITPGGGGYLWITNNDLFRQELHNFIDANKKNPEDHELRIPRGMQFDVLPMGRIFRVYEYVPGTMRYGGFGRYALK